MITLSDGTTTIELPADLEWADEDWQPVAQESNYSLTGALVVEATAKQAGRPFTLRSPPNQALATRAVVNQLRAWQAVAGKILYLTLDGDVKTVLMRHQDGAAVEANVLGAWARPIPNEALFFITVRLMEI